MDPIAGDVHAVRRDSHERYGARKIKAALERRGVTASRRRIVNIMKRRGMTSAYARRTFKPHKTRVNEARLANILDREFDGYEPRTHLASDLTYVRVGGKWAYVCLLIDLANRSIAGHSADTSRTADLVMAAFATLDFPLTEVEVFHTDRGSEFDNAKIDELLDVFDIRRSLSRKGNPYDNAVVESTNRLLKKELIYRNHYTSLEQLRSDLNDYVWWFNNQKTPLHPRIPESEGIHRTGTRPLRTCPTHRCQSILLQARHRRHRVQGRGRQGVPRARVRHGQQGDRGLGREPASRHGPAEAPARHARGTPSPGAEPILHSDMGWQYQHQWWRDELGRLGIRQSMSRKGNCLDNAATEQVFGHLKDEFYRGREFDSYERFKRELDAYIVHWNTRRRQIRLEGHTPEEFRSMSLAV